MKYSYIYKTRDGVRQQGSLVASSRDEVFTVLRTRGIRPIKVIAADGSRANGELRGVRKRVVLLVAAAAALSAALLVMLLIRFNDEVASVAIPQTEPRETEQYKYTGDIKEVQQYLAERERLERDYRDRIEERVRKGTLTRAEADKILQTVFK